uniref:Uncharacterized protein n=1 Tax=Rhizophora mucronata TaxID=61149 RepID=A0A2P2NEE7_RHIMU
MTTSLVSQVAASIDFNLCGFLIVFVSNRCLVFLLPSQAVLYQQN